SKNAERILGNEGDDWIETGTFDGAPGDSFDEIFAKDSIVGHDVFLGDGGFDEFIAEGGDDVMVGSPGRGKLAGMSGWDWVTYKDNTAAVDADLTRAIVFDENPNPPQNGTLDAYESVEGLSGSRFNDVLTGADTIAGERLPFAQGGTEGFAGSALDAAGIARIAGLQEVLGAGVTNYIAGDIILGGDGSDVITGRGGDDIIDGDKWLDVQIGVFAADDTGHTGSPISLHNSMKTLVNSMFAGQINPGQLAIVRTIRTDATAGDIDVAAYQGALADYVFGLDDAGRLTVTDVGANPLDGSDTLSNIEQLRFGGVSFNVVFGTDGDDVLVSSAGNDLLLGRAGNDTASYATAMAGVTVSLADAGAQVTGGAGTDALLSIENLLGSNFNDTLTAGAGANVLSGGGGDDTLNATVDNVRDTLNGGAGNDSANYAAYAAALTVNLGAAAPVVVTGSGSNAANSDVLVSIENFTGGAGGDVIRGSTAANVLNGGGGADTFFYAIGGGADTIVGGAGNDTLNIQGAGNADVLDVVFNGTITGLEGGTVTGVESIVANLGGNADTISYAASAVAVAVDLGAGTASGFTSIASILHATGGTGNDTLTGSGGANILNGGAGNDTLNGGANNDTLDGGVGNDTLDGGAGADTLNGGAGADLLIGGAGADTLNSGAANDNLQDIFRFSATDEFGDVVGNFDANGPTAAGDDRIEFAGALNTAWDDGNNNNNFTFASGNGSAGTVGITVGQANAHAEALLLTGVGGEGVTTANLGNAPLVAAAFNAEFNITAANGEDALLVINDTNGNSFSLWQWVQAGGGEVSAAELSLVGTFSANAAVVAANFDFV
ncbi:MAG: calcium-binding protein, partial [Comamonadaceae bacterium]